MMALRMASPRYSSRSLFSSAPSLTERWVKAILYRTALPGAKPSTFLSCLLKEATVASPFIIRSRIPTPTSYNFFDQLFESRQKIVGQITEFRFQHRWNLIRNLRLGRNTMNVGTFWPIGQKV